MLYFAYGLVFFLLGFAAALAARTFASSRLGLVGALPWLAGFGILVGFSQWGVMFIPLQAAYLPGHWLAGLYELHGLVVLAAHFCLLAFGLRLSTEDGGGWRQLLPTALVVGLVSLIGLALTLPSASGWHAGAQIVAAYGLGLPGAVLSARGILAQRLELVRFYPRAARWLLVAAWTFIVSVPIGPLAMPTPGGKPVVILGVPVEVPLTIGGLLLAWSLLYGLEALRLENARRLERAERREAILAERYRLAKELNDGVIQDLFAASMLLGAMDSDLPLEQRKLLRIAKEQMQGAVDRLRGYIMQVDPLDWSDPDLLGGIRRLVDDFKATTLLPVVISASPGLAVAHDVAREAHVVFAEALSNVRRHAGASKVTVVLKPRAAGVLLQVDDNGAGFKGAVQRGPGLERMMQSAKAAGGHVTFGRSSDGGARISLWLPSLLDTNMMGSAEHDTKVLE